jgi:hypothetical protein
MSDLTIGAADIAAVANQVNSVSQLLGSLIQLQLNLDAKIANAFEAAIDAIVEEKKADAEIDAPEIDRMSDVEEDEQILEASDEDQLTAEASSQKPISSPVQAPTVSRAWSPAARIRNSTALPSGRQPSTPF